MAFEPSLGNVQYLRRHVALNAIKNVAIEQAAVSDKTARAKMSGDGHSSTLRISPDGAVEVDIICLDDFVAAKRLQPDLVKIDVEGAEVDVLKGATTTLDEVSPILLIATHSPALKAKCTEILERHDYVVAEVPTEGRDELYARPRQPGSHRHRRESAHA